MTAAAWSKVMDMNSGTQLQWGPNSVDRYLLDPKRIGFMMARYKFAAKMLRDCQRILDAGCGDGMGTVTFLNETKAVAITGVDGDADLILHAQGALTKAVGQTRSMFDRERLSFWQFDLLDDANVWSVDGVCCLDVIEHIEPARSSHFLSRFANMLSDDGIAVIGTPSEYASQFASPQSQVGHINLYTPDRLRDELKAHFRHVFLFSMNDEIVHTGFDKLAHYLIALAVK